MNLLIIVIGLYALPDLLSMLPLSMFSSIKNPYITTCEPCSRAHWSLTLRSGTFVFYEAR